MNPEHLLAIAESLASGRIGSQRGRPRQAELRRAASATYYALFHTLAGNCANLLVGDRASTPTRQAWRQTYRSLDHRRVRKQCTERRPKRVLDKFPEGIQNFANQFVRMQDLRHLADYDPFHDFSRLEVLLQIENAKAAIEQLEMASRSDRRAFAVFVLFDLRRD